MPSESSIYLPASKGWNKIVVKNWWSLSDIIDHKEFNIRKKWRWANSLICVEIPNSAKPENQVT
jgi:hypothetical protein